MSVAGLLAPTQTVSRNLIRSWGVKCSKRVGLDVFFNDLTPVSVSLDRVDALDFQAIALSEHYKMYENLKFEQNQKGFNKSKKLPH
jgi:hypothetical protein